MVMLTFEKVHEYLEDRYTPAEVVDIFDIPMVDLIDCIWDYLQENREEQLIEIIDEGLEEDTQLELPF